MEQLGQGTQQHAPQAPQSLPSYQVALISWLGGTKHTIVPTGVWDHRILCPCMPLAMVLAVMLCTAGEAYTYLPVEPHAAVYATAAM